MPDYPQSARVQLQTNGAVKVTTSRARPYYSRGDTLALQSGITAYVVNFNTPLKDANWVFAGLTFWNSEDADIDIPFLAVVARVQKSAGGFTLMLNAPPLSDGHKLDWSIAERYNP